MKNLPCLFLCKLVASICLGRKQRSGLEQEHLTRVAALVMGCALIVSLTVFVPRSVNTIIPSFQYTFCVFSRKKKQAGCEGVDKSDNYNHYRNCISKSSGSLAWAIHLVCYN